MLKIFFDAWDSRNSLVASEIKSRTLAREEFSYKTLLALALKTLFVNDDYDNEDAPDYEKITEIDDGHYQGSLIFIFPTHTYQPRLCEYYATEVYYGSCSYCDTLERILYNISAGVEGRTDENLAAVVKDLTTLARDMICSIDWIVPRPGDYATVD